jgi:hypothetical protein
MGQITLRALETVSIRENAAAPVGADDLASAIEFGKMTLWTRMLAAAGPVATTTSHQRWILVFPTMRKRYVLSSPGDGEPRPPLPLPQYFTPVRAETS